MNNKEFVYIKDDEGFARKKLINEVLENETIITEEEYRKITGYQIKEQREN